MAAERTALITGASAGIGHSFAERLAQDGWNLILVARRLERLDALASRLRQRHGIKAEAVRADLTVAADVRGLEQRLATDEKIALLVNNAGFGGYKPFAELDPKVADDLIAVHIQAVTRMTRAALRGMLPRRAGGIINVASLLAMSGTVPTNPLPHRAVYAGAKAYLVTFTQALAGELAESGVRIQVCLPGIVSTEFHTSQGMARFPNAMPPEDVVAAALAGLERGEVTCVPGLEDVGALDRLSEAQRALLGQANRGALAPRYRSH